MTAPPRPVAPHVNPAFFPNMQSGTTSVVRLLFMCVCVCACVRACGLGLRECVCVRVVWVCVGGCVSVCGVYVCVRLRVCT